MASPSPPAGLPAPRPWGSQPVFSASNAGLGPDSLGSLLDSETPHHAILDTSLHLCESQSPHGVDGNNNGTQNYLRGLNRSIHIQSINIKQ